MPAVRPPEEADFAVDELGLAAAAKRPLDAATTELGEKLPFEWRPRRPLKARGGVSGA